MRPHLDLFSLNDNQHGAAFVFTFLASLLVLPCALALVVYARRRGPRFQALAATAVWIAGFGAFFWLDAVVVILALGVHQGFGLFWYLVYGTCWTLLFLGVAPRRGEHRFSLLACVLALWGWILVLPAIPWHESKVVAQDMRRVLGQPLEVARAELADYQVYIGEGRGPFGERFGDCDLGPVDDVVIRTHAGGYGGCYLLVKRGIVTGVFFLYD